MVLATCRAEEAGFAMHVIQPGSDRCLHMGKLLVVDHAACTTGPVPVAPPRRSYAERLRRDSRSLGVQSVGALKNAQAIANHESPKTTKLYDRTSDQITLDEVEPIVI